MSKIVVRPYTSADFSGCLAIFDSNFPTYFAPEEREQFCEHLENLGATRAPYIVLDLHNAVVACGGLSIDETQRKASLVWGMVDRKLHGQRLGTLLTQVRLTQARSTPGLAEVELATSQHTHGFYEGFGFSTFKVSPSGFGPGLDRWDMILRL